MSKEISYQSKKPGHRSVMDSSARFPNVRLPTPPPDPKTQRKESETPEEGHSSSFDDELPANRLLNRNNSDSETFNKEHEFLEYLLSLSTPPKVPLNDPTKQPLLSRTNSVFAQAIAADDAFDHLEKLYKLMEQLLNLREQNTKLQKRVHDLEHFKTVQEFQHKLGPNFEDKIILQDLESDPVYAESLLDNMLAAGKNASHKRNSKYKSGSSRFRQSLLGKPRDRSSSVAFEDYAPYEDSPLTSSDALLRLPSGQLRRTSASPVATASKPAKVSKWTKVKAAFKWEKASASVNALLPGAKSQDSGIGGMMPINNEVARYLRVPSAAHGSNAGGGGVSPADSVLSGHSSQGLGTSGKENTSVPATPATLSSASSVEDLHGHELVDSRNASRSEKCLRHRLSTCSDEDDFHDVRRSKSFDEDQVLAKDEENLDHSKQWHHKLHKTPWGKVKDIIQTRKDSLKKSRNRSSIKLVDETYLNQARGSFPTDRTRRSGSVADVCSISSGHEEYPDVFDGPSTSPVEKSKDDMHVKSDCNEPKSEHILCYNLEHNKKWSKQGDVSESGHLPNPNFRSECVPSRSDEKIPLHRTSRTKTHSPSKRSETPTYSAPSNEIIKKRRASKLDANRPTPMLTITIPSTEHCPYRKRKVSEPNRGDRRSYNYLPPDVVKRYQELIAKEDDHSPEPPSHRSQSKWTRVKKAFLSRVDDSCRTTSASALPQSVSVPTSPVRVSVFFPDDSDDTTNVSAKDDYVPSIHTKRKLQQEYSHPQSNRQLQDEIRRNYEELQTKLSQEFQEKIFEWERMKASNIYPPQNPSACTGCPSPNAQYSASTSSDSHHQHHSDSEFQRKMDEWQRMKQMPLSRTRDGVNVPLTSSEHLSAEFKKKLQEWQKMKKEQGMTTPVQLSSSTKKKITEWQFFKPGSSHQSKSTECNRQLGHPDTRQLSDDFLKKLEEWKHMKATNTVPSYSSYKDDDEEFTRDGSGNKTPSPNLGRKEYSGILKSPRQSTKKVKTQEDKELQWLEKELQKIEREKQRLEREREKFLDREERLAKIRRSVGGSGQQKKEVLVQTSTGFFRFEGISRKFTQRLYEWEKARGIGPEESTLMLLNPQYRPSVHSSGTRTNKNHDRQTAKHQQNVGIRLIRSKSMDSIANLTQMNSSITHQPSSLSLNDMEELEAECLAESRVCSEPEMREDAVEPEAMIVDVEDVEEETAAPFDDNIAIPTCVTHTPVYRYEQQQDDMLCEGEECIAPKVQGSDATKTLTNFRLIEDTINILNKLQDKGNICLHLDRGMESIEEEINKLEKTRLVELEKLRKYQSRLYKREPCSESKRLASNVKELERKMHRLRSEGETLQSSFTEHATQQAVWVSHLVSSLHQLQEANTVLIISIAKSAETSESTDANFNLTDVTKMIQSLSSELLVLAGKLEANVKDPCAEIPTTFRNQHGEHRTQHFGPRKYVPVDNNLYPLLTRKLVEMERHLKSVYVQPGIKTSIRSKNIVKTRESIHSSTGITDKSHEKSTTPPSIDKTLAVRTEEIITNVTVTPKFLRKPSLAGINDEKRISSKVEESNVLIPLRKLYTSEPETSLPSKIPRATNSGSKRKTKTRSKGEAKHHTDTGSDDDETTTKKMNKPRKALRTRVSSECKTADSELKELSLPTSKSLMSLVKLEDSQPYSNVLVNANPNIIELVSSNVRPESPVEIFVKTTRKLFTPVASDLNLSNIQTINSAITDSEIIPIADLTDKITSLTTNFDVVIPTQIKQPLHSNIPIGGSPIMARKPRLRQIQHQSSSSDATDSVKAPLTEAFETSPDLVATTLNKYDSKESTKPPKPDMEIIGKATPDVHPSSSDIKRLVSQPTSLPPLPNSPTPARRDRIPFKETAPSIRLMIARYNQRLTEQDGGKSPGGSSGSASPVAWRSPVFERRVRAQTEKYQEELRRVLWHGNWRGSEITKSASVGYMQTQEGSRKLGTATENGEKVSNIRRTPPPTKLLRGILKSSSAGSLKSERASNKIHSKISEKETFLMNTKQKKEDTVLDVSSLTSNTTMIQSDAPTQNKNVIEKNQPEVEPVFIPVSIVPENMPPKITRKCDATPPSPKLPIPSSPESVSNSPLSKVRALRLKQAKEEFLTRKVISVESPSMSPIINSPPEKEPTPTSNIVPAAINRLSQISYGSESSYDDSNSDGLLVKSASAGMINVDPYTYRQLASSELHSQGYVSLPRSNRSHKDIPGQKFGISSIASKFRKVRMRRQHKEKEPGKMNTISMLCRQSLLVDINDSSGPTLTPGTSQENTMQMRRSKSTSSSPVFHRQFPESKDAPSSPSCSGWKARIFKPK